MQPETINSAARLFNGPALIDPRHASSVSAGVIAWLRTLGMEGGDASAVKPQAMVPDYAQERADWTRYSVQDGIAFFPIKGALGWWWNDYQALSLQLRTCMADPSVEAVLFDMDSPGGLVSRLFDFVDDIQALRGTKPMWTLVNELSASAAYAIASATDRIIVPRTADVGSVGVVMLHLNMAGALKEIGFEITPIFAGAHKVDGNWWSKLPATVRERWQAEVDDLRDLFADTVARGRGMDADEVKATEALCYAGQAAVDIGFADEVMTAAEAVAALRDEISGARPGLPALSAGNPSSQTQENPMADTPQTVPAAADGQPAAAGAPTGTQGQQPAAPVVIEGSAVVVQTAADAVAAERARASGILALDEAKGREALAQHFATKTGMSVEDAKAALAAAAKEAKGGALGTAMAGVGNPEVGAGGDDAAAGAQDDAAKLADSIINSMRAASGEPVKGA